MKKFLITTLLLFSVFLAVGFTFLSLDKALALQIEKIFFRIDSNVESELKEATEENETEVERFATYYTDTEKGVYIAKINQAKSIEYIDSSADRVSLDTLGEYKNYKIGINSGYFLENSNHAGLLFLAGSLRTDYVENNQLTRIVSIENNKISLVDYEELDLSKDNKSTYFQTGPAIIVSGELQKEEIENSSNGNGDNRRSFIGYDTVGNIYVGFTTKTFSLVHLGEYINENNIYDGEVTLVNLDGGSSVAVNSTEQSFFNFGKSKRLPYFILIN